MWVDDEEIEVLKIFDIYILVLDIYFEYFYYINDCKVVKDELYWCNDMYNKDKVIFE